MFIYTLLFATYGIAQGKNKIFGKDPVINLENFHKQRLYFGYYLGFNSYDFKIDYKTVSEDVQVKKNIGFNVGLIANLRLQEYISLRFEPGLYITKRDFQYSDSNFSTTPTPSDKLREVNSTYIHFPLLFKISSVRTGNIRPYILAGISNTLNLSSKSESKDDNYQQQFRLKPWTSNYEMGLGIDIFSEYFIFSPSVRGVFGLKDELIRDTNPLSPWTGNFESIKSRGLFVNFTFH